MMKMLKEVLRQRGVSGPQKKCGKVVHSTEEEARIAMTAVVTKSPRHQRKPGRKSKYPDTYYCETCQGWHWGHSGKGAFRNRASSPGSSPPSSLGGLSA